jgi:hypothetical protein
MDSTSVGQLLNISKHAHIWLFNNLLHIKQHDGSKLPKARVQPKVAVEVVLAF